MKLRIPVTTLAFALSATLAVSGCAILRNTTYNLLTRPSSSGANEFDFVIGVDLIKDLGGDEDKVVADVLHTELNRRQYCPKGYELTFRAFAQGGGYLLFRGRCL